MLSSTHYLRVESCYFWVMHVTDCWLDLNFIVDSSGSVNARDPSNWDRSLQFVADVVREFTIGPNDVQVSFVLFSTEARVEWGLSEYHDKDTLIDAIFNVEYIGRWTNLNDAIFLTRTEVYLTDRGHRPGAIKATIILIDGEDNVPERGTPWTIENATLAKNDSIWLIAVGVTDGVDDERLREIVSSPYDYYPLYDFDTLTSIVDDLKSQICPTGPPPVPSKYLSYYFTHKSEPNPQNSVRMPFANAAYDKKRKSARDADEPVN